jgi:hypothetical protein
MSDTPVTYNGPHGTVTYTDGHLTVGGDVPWLVTHPKNAAAAQALAGNAEALVAYLRALYDEGIEWEQATRRLQEIPPV